MSLFVFPTLVWLSQASAGEAPLSEGARVASLLARQHPALVHFPIALVISAAFLELLICLSRRESWLHAQRFCLRFGALTAAVAGVAGWVWAREHAPSPELELHRWLGVAAAAASVVVAGLAPRWADSPRTRFRWALTLTVAAIVLAGHFGSYLVWGAEFFQLD